MKLTFKKDINMESIALEHDIVSQAIALIEGRESALSTEKKAYTLLSLVHNICIEDVIEECNEDDRSLIQILKEEIEPFYFDLKEHKPKVSELFNATYTEVERYCKKVYDEQHSVLGFLSTITEAISKLDNKEVQEVMTQIAPVAAEIAAQKNEQELKQTKEATDKITKKQEEINKNILKMMEQYNVKVEDEGNK